MCYRATVNLDFATGIVDASMLMIAGQELVETCQELYPVSFIGGCGHLKDRTMSLFFILEASARDFIDTWYMCRAKVLSKIAREMHSVDPDDIPF